MGSLVLERRDRRYVQIEVRAATRPLSVTARLATDRVLPRLAAGVAISEGQGQVESIDQQAVELREGEVVRVEIESKRSKVRSPELRP